MRTPLLILTQTCYSERRNGLGKNEESNTTQQNIDFVTSSEGYRPLQDLNLIDDYMFDIATMDSGDMQIHHRAVI